MCGASNHECTSTLLSTLKGAREITNRRSNVCEGRNRLRLNASPQYTGRGKREKKIKASDAGNICVGCPRARLNAHPQYAERGKR